MDRELAEAGAGRQALRQLQLEVLKPLQPMARQKRTMVGSLTPTPWASSAMELCMTDAGSLRT